MVEGAGLEFQFTGTPVTWVRIPPSPPASNTALVVVLDSARVMTRRYVEYPPESAAVTRAGDIHSFPLDRAPGRFIRRLEPCTIPGASYMVHHAQPERLAAEIEGFPQRHEARAAPAPGSPRP